MTGFIYVLSFCLLKDIQKNACNLEADNIPSTCWDLVDSRILINLDFKDGEWNKSGFYVQVQITFHKHYIIIAIICYFESSPYSGSRIWQNNFKWYPCSFSFVYPNKVLMVSNCIVLTQVCKRSTQLNILNSARLTGKNLTKKEEETNDYFFRTWNYLY